MRGNRYYLTSRNVEHHSYPLKKNIARVQDRFTLNYFEPTADGTGVKVTYISLVPSSEDGYTDTLQSIANLTNFLRQRSGQDEVVKPGEAATLISSAGAESEATPEKEAAEEIKENEGEEESKGENEHEEEQVQLEADPNSHLNQANII